MSQQLINGKQQFIDGNGNPLAGGSVAFCLPGTLTPTNTYQDPGLTILNTNPVILDANGMASIWGDDATQYRQIVENSAGVQLWDQVVGSISMGFVGSDTGTANTYAANLSIRALTAGMVVTLQSIVASNTGASTLSINSLGALPIQGAGGNALQGGELIAGYDALLMLNPAKTAWLLIQTTGGPLPVVAASNANHAINLGQFLASLGYNGYVKIPVMNGSSKDQMIVQWGVQTAPANATTNFNLPIAFTSVGYIAIGSYAAPWAGGPLNLAPASATQIGVQNTSSSGGLFQYIAIGK